MIKSMFKMALLGLPLMVIGSTACSSKSSKAEDSSQTDSKAIVCYFSATGTTATAAQRIADITESDIYEIVPEVPYSDADLDWRDSLSRSSVEMKNHTSVRTALKDSVSNLSEYSVVFLGYPNWWNTHPTIINTFIEANDLKGKTIIPFMTSGGSNITNSEKELHESYPSLNFAKGLLMNDVSDDDIKSWIKEVMPKD